MNRESNGIRHGGSISGLRWSIAMQWRNLRYGLMLDKGDGNWVCLEMFLFLRGTFRVKRGLVRGRGGLSNREADSLLPAGAGLL